MRCGTNGTSFGNVLYALLGLVNCAFFVLLMYDEFSYNMNYNVVLLTKVIHPKIKPTVTVTGVF